MLRHNRWVAALVQVLSQRLVKAMLMPWVEICFGDIVVMACGETQGEIKCGVMGS